MSAKITINQVVTALGAVKDGDGWIARCVFPANHEHGDQHPSLVISQTEAGKILVHCRSGRCEQADVWRAIVDRVNGNGPTIARKKEFVGTQADIDKAVAQLQQSPKAQGWLNERGISSSTADVLQIGYADWKFNGESAPTIVTPHYVKDQLVGVKFRRISPKDFTQAEGSNINGLYAADALDGFSDEVFVFEGEPDIALALSHGFNATGILCAQSKVGPEDVALLSKYRRIYLVGDQDLAGKKAMDELQKKLPAERIIRVRMPGLKDVGDLYKQNPADFAQMFGAIIQYARASREFFELDDLMTDTDLMSQLEDVTLEVVSGMIPFNAITMFFAEEKSGKSLLLYYILKCIANGTKVFGVLPTVKRPVLYLDRENSRNDIAGMVEHFMRIGPEPVRVRTRATGCPDVDNPWLIQFCEKNKPVLVFDSLTKFLKTEGNAKGADPFHPKDMSELFDKLLDLTAAGATVVIIHHSTKADFEQYANSHQIGANVSRAFCVISKDRPSLNRVRLEAKLFRGAEPRSFDLIGFPVISAQGMFALADPSSFQTDADRVAEWVRKTHPEGCNRETVKKEMLGMRAKAKVAAVREAIKTKKLYDCDGLLKTENSRSQDRERLILEKDVPSDGNEPERLLIQEELNPLPVSA